jgi:hypothetical protein
MSLVIAVAVLYGFGRTIDKALIHPDISRPFVLHLHAVLFTTWVIFFIAQSALIVSHNVKLHRSLGLFGAILGAAMIAVGVETSIVMARFNIEHYHSRHAALSLLVSFYDIAAFGVAFLLALLFRGTPETHRRLMLVATCALTAAAFGRFPIPAHIRPAVFFYACVDLLILLGAARDLIVIGKAHRVYLVMMISFIACQTTVVYTVYHHLPFWLKIAHTILG